MNSKTQKRINLVEPFPTTRLTASYVSTAAKHLKMARNDGAVRGIFLSEDIEGNISWSLCGVDHNQAVAILENAKHCMMKEHWGNF